MAGVGVGVAHPLVAADSVGRGLTVGPLCIEVVRRSVIALRAGSPLSEHAKAAIRRMRVQLQKESADLPAGLIA